MSSIRDRARNINDTLEKAQRKDSLGTAEIPIRVRRANDVLRPIQDDTQAIAGQLKDVEQNLLSACRSALLTVIAPLTPCGS
ncbi:MAG: hypothetical protein H0V92_09695 [Pseudonocardiales bacterium]|nr:hypothetical protein [Pseudonocardiales bacterium]